MPGQRPAGRLLPAHQTRPLEAHRVSRIDRLLVRPGALRHRHPQHQGQKARLWAGRVPRPVHPPLRHADVCPRCALPARLSRRQYGFRPRLCDDEIVDKKFAQSWKTLKTCACGRRIDDKNVVVRHKGCQVAMWRTPRVARLKLHNKRWLRSTKGSARSATIELAAARCGNLDKHSYWHGERGRGLPTLCLCHGQRWPSGRPQVQPIDGHGVAPGTTWPTGVANVGQVLARSFTAMSKARQHGYFAAFLPKPNTAQKLVEKVAEVIARPATARRREFRESHGQLAASS